MMKKLFLGSLCFVLVLFLFSGIAVATPVTFEETYLQQPGTPYFRLYEGYSVRFAFNLSQVGGFATIYNGMTPLGSRLPQTDETNYDPSLYETPFSAQLTFRIWDWDQDVTFENLKIRAGFLDGNTLLADKTYNIIGLGQRILTIDLGSLGLLDYLSDGKFITFAMAPEFDGRWQNDFNISEATLVAKANPVPEPSIIMLLGLGLAGIASLGRRRLKK